MKFYTKPQLQDLQEHWLGSVESTLPLKDQLRAMKDIDEAVSRLSRNNPRLSKDTAQMLVEQGVKPHENGGVRWKWDPGMNMVWSTFSHDESEDLLQWISSRVLLVTGEFAKEYWTQMRTERVISDAWYEQELARREKLFPDARHAVISEAGHMLHYDQPKRLNALISEFLFGKR